MTNQELIEYLRRHPLNSELSIVVANPKRRIRYETEIVIMITDVDHPTICLEVGEPIGFDAEETAVAEECENA